MNNLQIRSYNTEFTNDGESRLIHGLAIPVNSQSEYLRDLEGSYYEVILPSAMDGLIENNDIKVYLDHDPSQGTYARSKNGTGSLRLYVTERGLEFDFDAPTTVFGDSLLEGIRRGDYDAMSFAFYTGEDEWGTNDEGIDVHYIRSFGKVTEISILSLQPAYKATDVELRSLEKHLTQKVENALSKITEIEDSLNNLYKKYLDIEY